jgi:hypothetical protein
MLLKQALEATKVNQLRNIKAKLQDKNILQQICIYYLLCFRGKKKTHEFWSKMKQLISATNGVRVFRTAMTALSPKSWFQNSKKSTC